MLLIYRGEFINLRSLFRQIAVNVDYVVVNSHWFEFIPHFKFDLDILCKFVCPDTSEPDLLNGVVQKLIITSFQAYAK